jgi:hypothetical protein
MKIGMYAGEVRDVKDHAAHALIREKKAERVLFDPDDPSPPPPAEIAVTPDAGVTPAAKPAPIAKKKGRKS